MGRRRIPVSPACAHTVSVLVLSVILAGISLFFTVVALEVLQWTLTGRV